jgi:hypothetical protein
MHGRKGPSLLGATTRPWPPEVHPPHHEPAGSYERQEPKKKLHDGLSPRAAARGQAPSTGNIRETRRDAQVARQDTEAKNCPVPVFSSRDGGSPHTCGTRVYRSDPAKGGVSPKGWPDFKRRFRPAHGKENEWNHEGHEGHEEGPKKGGEKDG